MIDVNALEASANRQMFSKLGVQARVMHPDADWIDTTVLIDRDAKIAFEDAGVIEGRCEIGLMISEVGTGHRGTLVETESPLDPLAALESWRLLEPIGNDGFESRWLATDAG